jgi:hypothetical protein
MSVLPGERFAVPPGGPFVAGDIADRGPLERGTAPAPETRAREARELSRQREWLESASKAIDALKADEGTGPVNAADLAADDEALMDRAREAAIAEDGAALHVDEPDALPTLRVLPQGISRKRLEQAIRELQLPVIVARDVDEADVVMTIRSEYKQKTPMVREAEERAQKLLVDRRDELERLTRLLLDQETIDGEVVYQTVGRPVPGGRPQVLSSE